VAGIAKFVAAAIAENSLDSAIPENPPDES